MPKEVFGARFQFLPRSQILTFEEIERVVLLLLPMGLRKIRLTGGEPLLRRDLPWLVELLASLPGVELVLTTNGSLLADQVGALARAGLSRVTVSLDSLDAAVFRQMNGVDFPVARVLEGIEAAAAAGLRPIKVNAVVRRGLNDHTVVDFARFFKGSGHIPRFIEYMDVGTTNGWRLEDVVPGAEIVEMIGRQMPIEPVEAGYRGEVARRWRYLDGAGEFGVITSVTRPFCGDCTRARLSADGRLYTCLFASSGTDLRGPLRDGRSDAALADLIRRTWTRREDRYSEIRSQATAAPHKIEMSYIGG